MSSDFSPRSKRHNDIIDSNLSTITYALDSSLQPKSLPTDLPPRCLKVYISGSTEPVAINIPLLTFDRIIPTLPAGMYFDYKSRGPCLFLPKHCSKTAIEGVLTYLLEQHYGAKGANGKRHAAPYADSLVELMIKMAVVCEALRLHREKEKLIDLAIANMEYTRIDGDMMATVWDTFGEAHHQDASPHSPEYRLVNQMVYQAARQVLGLPRKALINTELQICWKKREALIMKFAAASKRLPTDTRMLYTAEQVQKMRVRSQDWIKSRYSAIHGRFIIHQWVATSHAMVAEDHDLEWVLVGAEDAGSQALTNNQHINGMRTLTMEYDK